MEIIKEEPQKCVASGKIGATTLLKYNTRRILGLSRDSKKDIKNLIGLYKKGVRLWSKYLNFVTKEFDFVKSEPNLLCN